MRLWILSTPLPVSEDTAYLIGRCTSRSSRVTVSRIEPTDDNAPTAPSEAIDAIVNRSFSGRAAFLRDLDRVAATLGVPVINPGEATLRACDKRSYIADFKGMIPPTWVAQSVEDVVRLRDEFGAELVLKDPFGKHGKDVIRFDGNKDRAAVEDLFSRAPASGVVAQAFCAGFVEGDKRIILHRGPDGRYRPSAWFNRVPQAGGWKSNISAGGQLQHCELEEAEHDLALRVAELSGLDCAGVDTAWHDGECLMIETNAYTGGHIDFDNKRRVHSGDDFACMVERIATHGRPQ